MTVTDTNILIEKAKTRKDGVYSHKGFIYAVKNNRFVFFADSFGYIYQRQGSFNVQLGKVETYERKNKLTQLLKQM